ncbi:hypothetical protein EG347_16365 [Chryseobacterium sp. G0186]|nr:hypothetical protein EG347_16365 [Chryseobacterium sp. G0186]
MTIVQSNKNIFSLSTRARALSYHLHDVWQVVRLLFVLHTNNNFYIRAISFIYFSSDIVVVYFGRKKTKIYYISFYL